MPLVDDPRVDCETLRELKATIARLRVSVEPAMLQPQVSRKPVMETKMTAIPQTNRRAQLALFGEQPAAPNWNDLTEPMRRDAVRLLAQLLVNVRINHLARIPHEQGGRDE
jgi:hypothetical protein